MKTCSCCNCWHRLCKLDNSSRCNLREQIDTIKRNIMNVHVQIWFPNSEFQCKNLPVPKNNQILNKIIWWFAQDASHFEILKSLSEILFRFSKKLNEPTFQNQFCFRTEGAVARLTIYRSSASKRAPCSGRLDVGYLQENSLLTNLKKCKWTFWHSINFCKSI